MMANSELRRTIKIEKPKKPNDNNDEIPALITFEKRGRAKGRFTFEFTDDEHDSKEKRSNPCVLNTPS
jgi:hypothetical protein